MCLKMHEIKVRKWFIDMSTLIASPVQTPFKATFFLNLFVLCVKTLYLLSNHCYCVTAVTHQGFRPQGWKFQTKYSNI